MPHKGLRASGIPVFDLFMQSERDSTDSLDMRRKLGRSRTPLNDQPEHGDMATDTCSEAA